MAFSLGLVKNVGTDFCVYSDNTHKKIQTGKKCTKSHSGFGRWQSTYTAIQAILDLSFQYQ